MLRPARVFVLIILTITSCSVWRTEDVTPQQLVESRSQATIRVTRDDGSLLVLERPAIHGDTLIGSDLRARVVQIPLNQVRRVETLHRSTGRTVGLMAG